MAKASAAAVKQDNDLVRALDSELMRNLAVRGKTAYECESGLKYFAQAL
jgi:hypothetical protein